MVNSEVYPITAKFEQETEAYAHIPLRAILLELLGEYEHGTADVGDLFPSALYDRLMKHGTTTEDMLEQVSSVYMDILLFTVNRE